MAWDEDELNVLQNTYYAGHCWPSLLVDVVTNQPLLGLLTLEDPLVNNGQENVLSGQQNSKGRSSTSYSFPFAMSTCQNVCLIQYVHRLSLEFSRDFCRKWNIPKQISIPQLSQNETTAQAGLGFILDRLSHMKICWRYKWIPSNNVT